MRIPIALLVALGWLAGCGFKGPLYLPPKTSAEVKPAAPPPASVPTVDEQRPMPPEAVPAPK